VAWSEPAHGADDALQILYNEAEGARSGLDEFYRPFDFNRVTWYFGRRSRDLSGGGNRLGQRQHTKFLPKEGPAFLELSNRSRSLIGPTEKSNEFSMNVLTKRVPLQDAPACGNRTIGLLVLDEPFERPNVRRGVELRQTLTLYDEPGKVDSFEKIATAIRGNALEFLDLGSVYKINRRFDELRGGGLKRRHIEPVVTTRVESDVALAAGKQVRAGDHPGRLENPPQAPESRAQSVARAGLVHLGPELVREDIAVMRLVPV
jgi:hypothetical protein